MEPVDLSADPAQLEAQVERFFTAHTRAQFSATIPDDASDDGEPLDVAATEDLLLQAYATAGIAAPHHIHWLDGPLELVAVVGHENSDLALDENSIERVPHCVWEDARLDCDELTQSHQNSIDYHIRNLSDTAQRQVNAAIKAKSLDGLHTAVQNQQWRLRRLVGELVADRLWRALGEATGSSLSRRDRVGEWYNQDLSLWNSISAYADAPNLIPLLFYDKYLAPNAAGALARFNEMVSGYWLGQAMALLVRKPLLLACDEMGRLHNATGPCVRYRDGWELYAWHGVRVPSEIILRSGDSLTRDVFLAARNLEVRRVIQERMGERFVWELGARYVHSDARGILYEVNLPDDPDRVARYLQVTDPSTGRVYYLRVPPSTQTAAEAAAWTFGLTAAEYAPLRES